MKRYIAVFIAVFAVSSAVVFYVATEPSLTRFAPPLDHRARLTPWVPAVPELALEPVPQPSAQVPTLVEAGEADVERITRALASELSHMWTHDPEELVDVVGAASRKQKSSPPVTLLLAIAHAETNGKILDVSEAGAVGLAQATPVAYLQERLPGKLFVTTDYLVGSRAYIMKKPLGDADTIATLLLDHRDEKSRAKAKRLLKAAFELRREGVDELQLLEPYATNTFFAKIDRADKHNLAVLKELQHLIDTNASPKEMRAFRDRTRTEYRALKAMQMSAWSAYQKELIAKREAMLKKQYGNPKTAKKEKLYEVSEYLGENLDARFSAQQMAQFLVLHLERKSEEACAMAENKDSVERLTAALYNGGSHNVKRMLAGLISSLPETQRYAGKVVNTRHRLDKCIAGVEPLIASAKSEAPQQTR